MTCDWCDVPMLQELPTQFRFCSEACYRAFVATIPPGADWDVVGIPFDRVDKQ